MNPAIGLYNNITYSLAAIVLLSTLIKSKKHKYAAAFVFITAVGLLLTRAANWIMPVNVVALTLIFTKERKDFRRTFYKCLTVIFLLWCGIVIISSPIMLIAPGWHGSNGFNILVGGTLLTASLVIKAKEDIMGWLQQLEYEGYAIALEIVLLLFLSFVLPRYYPSIAAESVRQWSIFLLSFMFVLAMVGFLVNRIKNLEYQRRGLAAKIEHDEAYKQQTLTQFEKMVVLKHFYTKLYHSLSPFIRNNDMDGLKHSFEKYIAPIHREYVETGNQIKGVGSELIRNLLDVTAGQAAAMEHVMLDIDISGNVEIPGNIEMDVFEIINNLIDNAIRELAEQESGLLRIWLCEVDGQLSIQIANTINSDIDIEKLYVGKHNIQAGHGYGLKRVRAIVYRHSGMEHFTYKDGVYEGKDVFVQQVKVDLERGW